MPEFQETKNFTLQGKDEDCQTSNKGNEDDKTTKDKVNNNIQTPEQETVSQGKQSDLYFLLCDYITGQAGGMKE